MTDLAGILFKRPLHIVRSVCVMLILAVYCFTAVSHGLCDLDVSKFAGHTEIALVDDGAAHDDGRAAADHHCHASFPALTAYPVVSAVIAVEAQIAFASRDIDVRNLVRSLELPPPKALT